MAGLAPYLFNQWFDDNGDPLNAGTIDAYEAGTLIRKDTFPSAAGTPGTENANPIVLGSAGRKHVFLEEGVYDFVLKDVLGNPIDTINSVDGSNGAGDGSFQIVEDILALKALPSGSSDYVDVGGYYDKGDGGGGRFFWDGASNASDNTGTVIEPDSAPATGRWIRNYDKFIRVEWFGTVGDGVVDDTNAIISASALSQNKELQFGSGTFLMTAGVQLLSDTTVRAVGKALFTSTTDINTELPLFTCADGCKFYDLESTGNTLDRARYCLIDTTGASNIIVENCTVTGMSEAVLIQTGSNIRVSNCHFKGGYRWMINIADATEVMINNNLIEDSVTLDGIKVNGQVYATDAVPVAPFTNCNNITITDNQCLNNDRDGIDFACGGNAIMVNDNLCIGNTLNGIECKLVTGGNLAERFVIQNNQCYDNGTHGIRADDLQKLIISDNICSDNGDNGIIAQNNIQLAKITDNLCRDNTGNGIRLQGSVTEGVSRDIDILDNRCIDNGVFDDGINIGNYVAEVTISGNQCYQTTIGGGKTNSGIAISGTTSMGNFRITDNYCPLDFLEADPINLGAISGDKVFLDGNVTHSTSVVIIADGDSTPSVSGGNQIYQTANTGGTNITAFDKGAFEMAPFRVFVNDANTTFVNGASLVLLGGVNYVAPTGAVLTFICRNNIYREIARADSNGGTSSDTTITNDLTVDNDVTISGSLTFDTGSESMFVSNAFSIEHDAGAASSSELFIKSKGSLELHIDSDASTANAELKFFTDDTTRIMTLNEAGLLDLPIGGITAASSISTDTTLSATGGITTDGNITINGDSKKLIVPNAFIMEHGGATGAANSEIAIKSNHNLDLWIDVDGSGSGSLFRIFHDTATELFRLDETGLVDIKVGGLNITGQLDAKEAVIFSGTETIAAGGGTTALDLAKSGHLIDADAGGDIFTLADGVDGQIKDIGCLSATGLCTITPNSLAGGVSITLNTAGGSVSLRFMTSSWYIMGGNTFTVI